MTQKKPSSINKDNFKFINPIAKNAEQKIVLKNIKDFDITIVHGPAGTGKTLISSMWGLYELFKGNYEKIIFTRPCVEAHEHLGFLPGDFNDKLAPYMIPIMDFMYKAVGQKTVESLIEDGKMVTLPLAFMRGTNFDNAFVLLDEAQNTVPSQVRMFLTRINYGSKIVITGDPEQSDIAGRNGLEDALIRFKDCKNIGISRLSENSIVRHPLIAEIESYYKKDIYEEDSIF